MPATLRDVAARAGVATITASRILNGGRSGAPVAKDTRRRVEAAAAELGYRIDAVAQAMRSGSFRQAGVMVANAPGHSLANLAAYEYILGLNAGLAACGYVMSIVRLGDVDGPGDEPLRALDERMLDAVVVLGQMPQGVTGRVRALGLPALWLDTDVDEAEGCLRRDEVAAGRAAAELLLARGRRRVVWLERPAHVSRNHYSRADRERGAQEACRAAGATFEIHDLGSGFEIADPVGLRRTLADPTAGLLLADPRLAQRMASRLAHFGLVPGRDLGVACCDADSTIAHLWPELSRVEPDRHALGEQAARMLVEAMAAGRAQPSQLVRSPVVAGETA